MVVLIEIFLGDIVLWNFVSTDWTAIRVGRELRFRVEDVERWEASRRDNGSTHSA